MSKVILSESLFKSMMEQLGYWADYCDDSEGYLAGVMEDAAKEVKQGKKDLSVVHDLICEKEGYDCTEDQDTALDAVFK